MGEWTLAVPREARPYQGRRAGLVTRTLAIGVDALTVALALAVGVGLLNAVVFLVDPRDFRPVTASVLVSLACATAVFVLYLTAAWSMTGRTYGDHVMGLRVVDRRGRRIRPATALARAVTYIAFPVGLLWCAGDPSRRSLQDRVFGTSVIYDWIPRRDPPPVSGAL